MEQKFSVYTEDMTYLLIEMTRLLKEYKQEIPDDVYKILLDLIYHSKNNLKEMEDYYEKFIKARISSVFYLYRL